MLDVNDIAKAFKELGHPVRLTIIKSLVNAGGRGLSVGHLQQVIDIPASTLSHHISSLVAAQLVTQNREGRILYCVARYDHLSNLSDFLFNECCKNENAP